MDDNNQSEMVMPEQADGSMIDKPLKNPEGESKGVFSFGKRKVYIKKRYFLPIGLSLIFISLFSFVLYFYYTYRGNKSGGDSNSKPAIGEIAQKIQKLEKFSSEEEYKNYIKEGQSKNTTAGFGVSQLRTMESVGDIAVPNLAPGAQLSETGGGLETDRYSETNVQVKGIDEPDILKTDGKNIFYSKTGYYYERPVLMEDTTGTSTSDKQLPDYQINGIKVVNAYPSQDLRILSTIGKSGEILIYDNKLIVFSGNEVTFYNISEKNNPVVISTLELPSTNRIEASRLYGGKLYLVVRTTINSFSPCTFDIYKQEGKSFQVSCTDIYRPSINIPVDATLTAMVINVEGGNIEKKVSFIGSSSSTVNYMSENNLYITYSYYQDFVEFIYNFLSTEASDLVPQTLLDRLNEVKGYNLSNETKLNEVSYILEEYMSSLSDDDRLKLNNEIENRGTDYFKKHQREFERTGIVKIGLSDLNIVATGSVPGKPLNQFSLDEYQENLRIATTFGNNFWTGNIQSASDVYTLDKNLVKLGEVNDLGLGERIYSVRFFEDKGYVVTFRQIDPFYVIDLSDAAKPLLKGELKIPGYSAYLHPINKNSIIGIGEENNKVKVSLFDVSDPGNPVESAKYNLDDYYSEIQSNHHAFLMDRENNYFFIPGSRGGYVLSYLNNSLRLLKAVSGDGIKRATYIRDDFYVVSDSKIEAYDIKTWDQVKSLDI